MRGDEFGVEPDHLAARRDGAVRPPLSLAREPQVTVCEGVFGVERDGLPARRDGAVQIAPVPQRETQVVPDGAVVRSKSPSGFIRADLLAVLAVPLVPLPESKGQFKVRRVLGAGRAQNRRRIQLPVRHQLRQHAQGRWGRGRRIGLAGQLRQRVRVVPHGRVAQPIRPRPRVRAPRHCQEPIPHPRIRFVQCPVVHRRDQLGPNRRRGDPPRGRGRFQLRQVQPVSRERPAVLGWGDLFVEVTLTAFLGNPDPLAESDVVQLHHERQIGPRLFGCGEQIRRATPGEVRGEHQRGIGGLELVRLAQISGELQVGRHALPR